MTCREFVAFLLDYVEDQLPGAARARFDAHLAECPDCVRFLQDYRRAVTAGRAALDEEVWPEDVPEELVAAIASARRAE